MFRHMEVATKIKCMAAAAATNTEKEKQLQNGIYSLPKDFVIISTQVCIPSKAVARKSSPVLEEKKNSEVTHLWQMTCTSGTIQAHVNHH